MNLKLLDKEIKDVMRLMMTCVFLSFVSMIITYARFPDKLWSLASVLFIILYFLVGIYGGLIYAKKVVTR